MGASEGGTAIEMGASEGGTAIEVEASEEAEPNTAAQPLCGSVKLIWAVLLCGGLDTCLGVMRGLVLFPFLRTTIDCDPDTPQGFDKASSHWSGSDLCADRCHVAEEAQQLRGIADGMEQGLQLFCLPIWVRHTASPNMLHLDAVLRRVS